MWDGAYYCCNLWKVHFVTVTQMKVSICLCEGPQCAPNFLLALLLRLSPLLPLSGPLSCSVVGETHIVLFFVLFLLLVIVTAIHFFIFKIMCVGKFYYLYILFQNIEEVCYVIFYKSKTFSLK